MATDISTLGIEVETSSVRRGSDDLDKLSDAGKKTEKSVSELEAASKKLSLSTLSLSDAIRASAKAFGAYKIADYIRESTLLNARYETLGISMEVVGKHAGYTTDQMEASALALQATGISMVESRQQAMRLVQAHIDLADSTKLARIAQDAAVIGNINSSEAFDRLVHGISTGQTEVLRGIGINVNMDQSYKALAQTLGKNTDLLTQNEKTQAVLNSVMDRGKDIAGTYEAAMDTAGKQINSMTRYTEDLKVKIGEVFNEALTVSVMAFTSGLKDANGEISQLSKDEQLAQWGRDVTDVLAAIADNANNAYQALKILAMTGAMVKAMGDTTPMDFAGREGILEAYKADVDAALATEDRFTKALSERRQAVADKDAKRMAASLAVDVDYAAKSLEVSKAYAGASIEVQRQAQQALAKGFFGDNHKYSDTSATKKDKPKGKEVDDFMTPAAKEYAKAIEQMNSAQIGADASTRELNGAQEALFNLMSSPEWSKMPETWKQTAIAQAGATSESIEALDAQKRLNEMISATPTAKLEESRARMMELKDAFEAGKITAEQFSEAAGTYLGTLPKEAEKTASSIDMAITNSFQGMSDALADFIMTGKGSFGDLVNSMIRDLIRLEIQMQMTSIYKSVGGISGIAGMLGFSFTPSPTTSGAGTATENWIDSGGLASTSSLPSFDVGTDYVPRDMVAKIHEGERITPAKFNPAIGNGDGVVVNINNNATGTQATQSTRQEGGKTIIDVLIDQVKSALINDVGRGGDFAGALEGTYAVNRSAGAWR